MFGPAQRAVAMAVADCVEDGTIPADEADNLFICVGVFIHWLAEDDKKIQDYNYQAVQRVDQARGDQARRRPPKWSPRRAAAAHPFQAKLTLRAHHAMRCAVAARIQPGCRRHRADRLARSVQRLPGTMPLAEQAQHCARAVRAGRRSPSSAQRARSARRPRRTSSNLCGLTTFTRDPARAEFADQDVGDRSRRRPRAAAAGARRSRRRRRSRDDAVVDGVGDAVGVAGAGARHAGVHVDHRAAAARCNSASWMPMTVSPHEALDEDQVQRRLLRRGARRRCAGQSGSDWSWVAVLRLPTPCGPATCAVCQYVGAASPAAARTFHRLRRQPAWHQNGSPISRRVAVSAAAWRQRWRCPLREADRHADRILDDGAQRHARAAATTRSRGRGAAASTSTSCTRTKPRKPVDHRAAPSSRTGASAAPT